MAPTVIYIALPLRANLRAREGDDLDVYVYDKTFGYITDDIAKEDGACMSLRSDHSARGSIKGIFPVSFGETHDTPIALSSPTGRTTPPLTSEGLRQFSSMRHLPFERVHG